MLITFELLSGLCSGCYCPDSAFSLYSCGCNQLLALVVAIQTGCGYASVYDFCRLVVAVFYPVLLASVAMNDNACLDDCIHLT